MQRLPMLVACVWSLAFIAFAAAQEAEDLLKQAAAERQVAPPRDPQRAAECLRQADQLVAAGKLDEAIELYRKAYQLDAANGDAYARLLKTKEAAGRLTAEDRQALELVKAAEKLKVDHAIKGLQLDILQTREALRRADWAAAQTHLARGRDTLAALPADLDVAIYRNELRQLSTRLAALKRRAPAAEPARLSAVNPDDTQPDAASHPAVQRTPVTEITRYEPDGRILVPSRAPEDLATSPYFRYQADIDWAMRSHRASEFLGLQRDRVIPREDLSYPADWEEKSRRRAAYGDGELYRGPTFQGEDGEEYYTAIYDISELVQPHLDVYGYDWNAFRERQSALDREWIRRRSMIFGGWASDLAEGIPLLHYFGGIDNWAYTRPFDPYERDKVVATIEEFLKMQRRNAPPASEPQP